MRHVGRVMQIAMIAAFAARCVASVWGQERPVLPPEVKVVWDLEKAWQQTTATRQRVCINGLWRWRPGDGADRQPPAGGWGYFKIPGCWPGITDYMQKDCQTLFVHPDWRQVKAGEITIAWHQREITIPAGWANRRIVLDVSYLNSHAAVWIDGARAGEIRFPAGELDITPFCRPGARHTLSMLVSAMPLKAVLLSYTDTAAARQVKGTVARRGLCGDVYLAGLPRGPAISALVVDTSVRRWQISFDAAVSNLQKDALYVLRARVTDGDKTVAQFQSGPFGAADLRDGRMRFAAAWKPAKLWDVHTPGNMYSAELSLHTAGGEVLDVFWPVRFGFREFWIDGRDFYLNGTRIYLSAVPLDNAQVGAAWATYEAARESLLRLMSFGINFVYTHNYGCEPGSHLSFEHILRAADDVGMLVALSQPHFAHYDWKSPDADRENGYAQHAAFYARVAGNHPSVIAYSMSHNATGYSDDMNPDMIDGVQEGRDQWARNNAALAQRAEAIVRRLDPSRIVYHHASGNLGVMHTTNFYANFAPIQEMSEWFGHWATKGVKPLFTCEYAVPFTWDWTMYRGWYKGQRAFGSARVPWEFCVAEWNAQFLGHVAYAISEPEKTNLRWEARQFRAGNVWHRWDYPYEVGSRAFDERYPIIAAYITDNWRAFRTWGVSANSPWEYGHYWKLREGVNKGRTNLPTNWDGLQQPGFSPDYIEQRYERFDLAFEQSDWIATPAARALIRNNRPLLAYIGGQAAAFTARDHNYHPGQPVEKQLILINNSRQPAAAQCSWLLGLPRPVAGQAQISIAAGDQQRVPLRFVLPEDLPTGEYQLRAEVRFDGGETQTDVLTIDVLPRPVPPAVGARFGLFDPVGETTRMLKAMNIAFRSVDAASDLSAIDVLIIGRAALSPAGAVPDVSRVRDGLKVVVFEQTSEALEKRLGFRVVEYGLRQTFRRVAGHPLLAGLEDRHLRDWRGEATLLPPRLKYEMRPRYGPTVMWCDIPVTRAWRCGNRGNVASVLIEKPPCGDFVPIIDGGYALQFAPLLEYREGRGMVLFCQMDVTARTEADPAAETLVRNIIRYAAEWRPAPRRAVVYCGGPAGREHLISAGFTLRPAGAVPTQDDVVVLAAGDAGAAAATGRQSIAGWFAKGGRVLSAGLDAGQISAVLGRDIGAATKIDEHIATCFDTPGAGTALEGVSPADVHNRDPRRIPLVSGGADVAGNGVLATASGGAVVLCQLVPWQFDRSAPMNQKRTFRRTAFALSRLLANMGADCRTPLLERFARAAGTAEKRFAQGLYLDIPEEWDDPYRFFRW